MLRLAQAKLGSQRTLCHPEWVFWLTALVTALVFMVRVFGRPEIAGAPVDPFRLARN